MVPFELADQLKHYQGIGVDEEFKIQWSKLMSYKHQIIDPLADQLSLLFTKVGIDIIHGHSQLLDEHTVTINDDQYESTTIVLGTGQHSRKLPILGNEYLHDSRDFLDIKEMPKRITFIGAGIISLEFASIATMLGSEVNIVEFAPNALGNFYQDHVNKIVNKLRQQGVNFYFNEAVSKVVKNTGDYTVTTNSGLSIDTDYVLDATGRIANVETLGLEKLGIGASPRGIQVDSHLRTSVKNIYASGDVIDKQIPKLTPTAIFESNYIAADILNNQNGAIEYPVVPSVIFTLPRLAQVGVPVQDAFDDIDNYHTETIPYGKQMLFQSKNEKDAELVLIFDKAANVVGSTIYGEDAPDLINFLTLIISKQLSARELNQMIFAFPSTSIGVISLVSAVMERVAHIK